MIGSWIDAREQCGLSPVSTFACDVLHDMGFGIERAEEYLCGDGRTRFRAIAKCPCGTGSSAVSLEFSEADEPPAMAKLIRSVMREHIADDIARGALPEGFGR